MGGENGKEASEPSVLMMHHHHQADPCSRSVIIHPASVVQQQQQQQSSSAIDADAQPIFASPMQPAINPLERRSEFREPELDIGLFVIRFNWQHKTRVGVEREKFLFGK